MAGISAAWSVFYC